jgi:hypothetical protein
MLCLAMWVFVKVFVRDWGNIKRYRVGSSHFFGIGISRYQINTAGIGIFWSVLLYCKLWRENFLRFRGNSLCTKRGPRPPLLGKKGAPANFLRGSRQCFDTKNTDQVFLQCRYLV